MVNKFSLVNSLKELDKKELIELVKELSKLNKDNKIYLKTKLSNNDVDLFKESLSKLNKSLAFYESMSLKDARKVLVDFKKLSKDKEKLIDLYFHYLYLAREISFDWRVQENLILAIERVFKMLINEIKDDENLKTKYRKDIKDFIDESIEGYGHQERLEEIWDEGVENGE